MGGGRRAILWGVLLILVGVVWLLRTAGVIGSEVAIWPVVLVAIGLWLLSRALVARGTGAVGFVWPLVIIAVGGVFLLRDLDVIDRDVSVWPVVVIAVGLGFVLSALPARHRGDMQRESVRLDGARSARIELRHGAGKLTVGAGLDPDRLLTGSFAGGVDVSTDRRGEHLAVRLRQRGADAMDLLSPWNRGGVRTLDWQVDLSRRIPLELMFKTGANSARLDLRELQVTELRVETGASQTDLVLPAHGRVTATIKAGAAGVTVTVPERTAARIVSRTGLAEVTIDERRFPRTGSEYRSDGYEAAADRVDLTLEAGAAQVEVR